MFYKNFNFDYNYNQNDMMRVFPAILGFVAATFIIIFVICIILYVLESIGLYTIASRREIKHPGLAWIPVIGSSYILGKIADDIKEKTDKKTNYAVYLLIFSLAMLFCSLILTNPLFVVAFVGTISFSIIYSIFKYIALYIVYAEYTKNLEILFLVLSIVFSFLSAIFVFAIRNAKPNSIDMPVYDTAKPKNIDPEL